MIEINYSLTKEQSRIRIWRCGALVVMLPSKQLYNCGFDSHVRCYIQGELF